MQRQFNYNEIQIGPRPPTQSHPHGTKLEERTWPLIQHHVCAILYWTGAFVGRGQVLEGNVLAFE